ncbi:SDR family oxidoreductase [Lactobacillaceae bacterium L1_55_11]|nr:SDR family oxidoreductase [Lactobacillaceae bacterium L1_55_11]
MKKIAILGAGGRVAAQAIPMLLKNEDYQLTLLVRNPAKVAQWADNPCVKVVEGDATQVDQLVPAIEGQDLVYVNLAGNVDVQLAAVVAAMEKTGVKRLIFIATLGIYDEVPGKFGQWNHQMIESSLKTYRKAADEVEASPLDYTIIRPAWLDNEDTVDYEITHKGEPFRGTSVSRKSVADLVVKIIDNPKLYSKESIGINQPNTDGDKPSFY